jgi:hypothetical protein
MASLYHPEPFRATTLSGRYLAHAKTNRVERAFLAADLVSGRADLVAPTITQAAVLARVNPTYVHWAIRREENRIAILAGGMPLVPPLRLPQVPVHLRAELNDAELIDIARIVGSDRLLEAACLAEGNAA